MKNMNVYENCVDNAMNNDIESNLKDVKGIVCDYLHSKFPNTDLIAFENLSSKTIDSVIEAKEVEEICDKCRNTDGKNCLLPANLQRGHAVVRVSNFS